MLGQWGKGSTETIGAVWRSIATRLSWIMIRLPKGLGGAIVKAQTYRKLSMTVLAALCICLATTSIYLFNQRREQQHEQLLRIHELSAANSDLRAELTESTNKVRALEIKMRAQEQQLVIKPVAQIEFADGNHLMLMSPMTYKIGQSEESITVPAGFVHDRASVPSFLRSIQSTHGPFGKAAIVHDYLYWAQPCSKEQADNLMYIAMLESEVSAIDRAKIMSALTLAGGSAFRSNRRARGAGDFRVVPEHHRDIAATDRWSDFHARLKASGVADPGFEKAPSFCALGDRREVPMHAKQTEEKNPA